MPKRSSSINQKTFPFEISSLTPQGQGVYKDGKDIYFIPKTLPGEKGVAKVLKKKKGVHFAKLISLETSSQQRQQAFCPHYSVCPGCHYQHMSYQRELKFKEQALRDQLRNIIPPEFAITRHSAPDRQGHRNRAQFHFDKNKQQFGYLAPHQEGIISIDTCPILSPLLQQTLKSIYNNWQTDERFQGKGHIELYEKQESVQVSINEPYAKGGFSQVYQHMGQVLAQQVTKHLCDYHHQGSILELFSGTGHLTKEQKARVIGVDYYTRPPHTTEQSQLFIHQDLYHHLAQKTLTDKLRQEDITTLVLNPPRTGFKHLVNWAESFKPQALIYVSCNPATLARDLLPLKDQYHIKVVELLDLFPSTYHFETLVVLVKS